MQCHQTHNAPRGIYQKARGINLNHKGLNGLCRIRLENQLQPRPRALVCKKKGGEKNIYIYIYAVCRSHGPLQSRIFPNKRLNVGSPSLGAAAYAPRSFAENGHSRKASSYPLAENLESHTHTTKKHIQVERQKTKKEKEKEKCLNV